MWMNPKYHPESGERLATFPRDDGAAELRLTRDEYEGHPYLSLRLWRRGHDGQCRPTRKGSTIRMGEVPKLVEALSAIATAAPSARRADRALPAAVPVPPPSGEFDECSEPPRPATPTINPPQWLLDLAAGHDGHAIPLRGTPKQVAWAESIRATRIRAASLRAPEAVKVLALIHDATWWIANAELPLADLAWPDPEQVTPPHRRIDT